MNKLDILGRSWVIFCRSEIAIIQAIIAAEFYPTLDGFLVSLDDLCIKRNQYIN